mmetsp:Transcript_23813/g.44217  ORF Transcript_23813/g.44217 Transcript_23813/m.44217 type:complete len:545 (+) Transcript_23813:149-1783(+)
MSSARLLRRTLFVLSFLYSTSELNNIFEYDCPQYDVVGDHQAQNGIAVKCRIWLCPGQIVEASMCGNDAFGDNFIRLYNEVVEITSNDDYCGQYGASRLIYTYPYDAEADCVNFWLHQGCYDVLRCWGTSHITIIDNGYGHPTGEPSKQPSGQPSGEPTTPTSEPSGAPSLSPSGEPTSIPSYPPPTLQPTCIPSSQPSSEPTGAPSVCPTSEPSSQPISAPSGAPTLQPSVCPSAIPSCAPTSPTSQPSGQPSFQPSSQPTSRPSALPSNQPSAEPTAYGSTWYCDEYEVTGDNRALGNMTVECKIWGCPGQNIEVNLCRHSFGDTYIRLYNALGADVARNDDGGCGQYGGSRLWYNVFTKGVTCRWFYLHQGCYDEVTCGGQTYVTVLGSGHPTSIPSGEPSGQPTSVPTSPTSQPSNQPSTEPSGQPSVEPTILYTAEPSSAPSGCPSNVPSGKPSGVPTETRPTSQPSNAPVVDETATILIAVFLPFGTCLVALTAYCVFKHYKMKYYGRLNAHKVRCVDSTNCRDEDILTQIDFFEEFY